METHGSISAKAARRRDVDQLVEIEIDNRLQRLASGAVAQRLGQRVEPSGILRLQREECGDGGLPLLCSAGAADWARRARRCRSAVADVALANTSLTPIWGMRTRLPRQHTLQLITAMPTIMATDTACTNLPGSCWRRW